MNKDNTVSVPKKFRDLKKSFLSSIVKNNNFSFKSFPRGLKFYGKESNEEIILVIRAHWIVLAFQVFIAVIILSLPLFVSLIFSSFGLNSFFEISLYISSFVIATTIITDGYVKWFYNVSIITNERIVDLDFVNVMSHSMSEAQLDRIEDVTHKQIGALGSLFDIGSVYVQTAGAKSEIEFHNIPRPRDVQDILVDLLELKKGKKI
jgi:membrane protein YdbS with pleckstrin-like domain